MTIKDLYNKFSTSSNGSWKRLSIKQVNENTGEIIFSKIKNVFNNGVKKVLRLTTSLGYTIECTGDHKIYTPYGFIKADTLSLGYKIYVNGTTCNTDALYMNYNWLYYQNITLNKTFVQISKEFQFNVSTLKKWAKKLKLPKKGTGYFHLGRTPWNKGLTEDNPMVKRQADALRKYHYDKSKKGKKFLKIDTANYQKHMGAECIVCHTNDDLEVHHIDENRKNNYPENLATLCPSCHQRTHNKNLLYIYADSITKIESVGMVDVYDIEMDSDFHNFVANGVVVHNCNYSKSDSITIIEPFGMDGSAKWEAWSDSCLEAEKAYLFMIANGATPQQARAVLPNSLKTELIMTANLREWRHFLKLRTSKAAHPDMRVVAIKLLHMVKEQIPIIFDDISEDT